MKIVSACIISLFIFLNVASQSPGKSTGNATIHGHITDSASRQAIEYATITLIDASTKKIISGTVTDKDGAFSISEINPGQYFATIEFIGYRKHTTTTILIENNKTDIDLAVIHLAAARNELQNVTVTSSKGLITNKIDKMIFNAEKDITSAGGVATDILKKIPQISVDIDGNVELAGTSSIRFLINGKPSAAFGSNISDVLQAIPASQIKSIEVITNPGAKYDAEGLGGIINIILKESKVKGINGNLSLTAGTRNENGSFNLNARKGNFGVSAFISGNYRLKATSKFISDRNSQDPALQQKVFLRHDGQVTPKRHGFETGAGFDWTYKEKNNFSGSFHYGNFGGVNSIRTIQTQSISTFAGTPISNTNLINRTGGKSSFDNIDLNLNYKRKFAKEDQELEIDINSSYNNSVANDDNEQSFLPVDTVYYGTKSRNPGHENETEIQVDYVQPLKEDVLLGIGGKMVFFDINSNASVLSFMPDTKGYTTNASLSNSFDYRQNVYALYSELSFPVKEILNVKLGARYERTEINSFFSNAQQQTPQHGYSTVVPSIFFSHKIDEDQLLKLSFAKRIERPDYGDLNPFVNTSDPKNLSSGNPYLRPEIGNRYELSYNLSFKKAGSLSITAFYRLNFDDIQPFIFYYPSYRAGDSIYTDVSVLLRQNIGTEKNKGMSFFIDLHPGSALTLRSNIFFFHRHTINKLDPDFNTNSFNYRFNLNASYQFNKTTAAEFFGNFNSPRNEAQGKYPSFITYSFAFRRQLWEKKGSIALSFINPFSNYVTQNTHLFGSNFTVDAVRKVPFRSISLNFTWKFGKLEFKKSEEKNENISAPE